MSFLLDHARIDEGHVRNMPRYIDYLVPDDAAVEEMCSQMALVGELFGRVVQNAFTAGTSAAPQRAASRKEARAGYDRSETGS